MKVDALRPRLPVKGLALRSLNGPVDLAEPSEENIEETIEWVHSILVPQA